MKRQKEREGERDAIIKNIAFIFKKYILRIFITVTAAILNYYNYVSFFYIMYFKLFFCQSLAFDATCIERSIKYKSYKFFSSIILYN